MAATPAQRAYHTNLVSSVYYGKRVHPVQEEKGSVTDAHRRHLDEVKRAQAVVSAPDRSRNLGGLIASRAEQRVGCTFNSVRNSFLRDSTPVVLPENLMKALSDMVGRYYHLPVRQLKGSASLSVMLRDLAFLEVRQGLELPTPKNPNPVWTVQRTLPHSDIQMALEGNSLSVNIQPEGLGEHEYVALVFGYSHAEYQIIIDKDGLEGWYGF